MKKLGFWVACLLSHSLWAQINIGNNLYTENEFSLNPAYAGVSYQVRADLQATRFRLAQAQEYTGGAFYLQGGLTDRLGLGMRVQTSTQSVFAHTSAEAVAACHVPLSWSQRLSFGLSFGFNWDRVTQDYSGQNAYVDPNDPVLNNTNNGHVQPLAGVGMVYTWSRLSVAATVQDMLTDESRGAGQYLGQVTYLFGDNSERLMVQPSVLLCRQGDRSAWADLNAKVIWQEQWWAQLGYRTTGNLMMGAGASFREVHVGYAFGYPIGKYQHLATSVHELTVSFRFRERQFNGQPALIVEPAIEGK
ncbi:type IX secretion system membrane protein, PorP/SprF family [Catalinimonas alkaloidigena]|uniref:Type IX secretion system membrane protein, PorP/SprF family n=1 Tax=Catalinimonas alkaloidigena TaxID=1075417 RepID=A0A1G8XGB8_9BACT|nr:PorP/SprF family type IX secretion system membrane protein [Catalinimonas alkaloidigena]SDJ89612.1 type IX secretion system membrane protein, PorP/SprF family [Catalinimonas alkaloidigena]